MINALVFIFKYYIVFLSIFYLNCQINKPTGEIKSATSDIQKIYPLKQNLSKDKSLMDISSVVSFVQLKNLADSVLLPNIDKIKLYNHQYYILDSRYSNFIICAEDGTFIKRIGQLGTGLGEYQSADDFAIDTTSNQIILLSAWDKALLFYSMSGDFITKKKLPIYGSYFFLTSDYNYTFYTAYNTDKDAYNLISLDKNWNITHKYFPFDQSKMDHSLIGIGGISFCPLSINYLIQNGISNTLYRFKNNTLTPYCEFDFGITQIDISNKKLSEIFKPQIFNTLSILMTPFCETTECLSYKFGYKQRYNFGFYSKISNNTFAYDHDHSRDFLEQVFPSPVGVTEDGNFLSVGLPEKINSSKNSEHGQKLYADPKFMKSKIYKIINESRDSLSPYILQYKMNF